MQPLGYVRDVCLPVAKGRSACCAAHLMSPSRCCHSWASANVAHPSVFAPGCLPARCDLASNHRHDSGKHFCLVSALFLSGSSCSRGKSKFPGTFCISSLWRRTGGRKTSKAQTRYELFLMFLVQHREHMVICSGFLSCLLAFREEICSCFDTAVRAAV